MIVVQCTPSLIDPVPGDDSLRICKKFHNLYCSQIYLGVGGWGIAQRIIKLQHKGKQSKIKIQCKI